MRHGSNGEVPGRRVTGAASRFDRYGVRRGLPYAADPDYDEPDGGYDDEPDGAAYDDPYDTDEPPSWATDDGDLLALPAPVWAGWRRRWGRPRRPWPGPWPARPGRPRRPPADRLDRVGRLVAGARRIGTARSRRTGERFPLYGSRTGTRSWRIVARPRGGLSREIVLVSPAGAAEELEAFPLAASPGGRAGAAAAPGTTLDGYRLRLPHAGVHAVMARLHPDQLRDLAGGDLPADPAAALVGSIARLARRARRAGTLRSRRSGERLSVFRAPGYRILARPRGAREAEILLVRPVEGEEELETTGTVAGPVRVEIEWTTIYPFDGPPSAAPRVKNAIYVLYRDGRPIMAGKAGSTTVYERMAEYRRGAHIFGVSPATVRAHVGIVRNPGGLKIDQVESLVIRLLIRMFGQPQVRNANKQVLPFPVGTREIVIEHRGEAIPDFLRRPLEFVARGGKMVGRNVPMGARSETRFYAGVEFELAGALPAGSAG